MLDKGNICRQAILFHADSGVYETPFHSRFMKLFHRVIASSLETNICEEERKSYPPNPSSLSER